MEEFNVRKDFPLKMDIAREKVSTWVTNFLTHAQRARDLAPDHPANTERRFIAVQIGLAHEALDELLKKFGETFPPERIP